MNMQRVLFFVEQLKDKGPTIIAAVTLFVDKLIALETKSATVRAIMPDWLEAALPELQKALHLLQEFTAEELAAMPVAVEALKSIDVTGLPV